MSLFRVLAVVLLFVFCVGCERQAILSDIDARQSIDVLLALSENGIHAERRVERSGRKESYSITVDDGDSVAALKVLREYNLPRSESESVQSITQPKGFVPNSPQIDALRLDHALATEVERLVSALPGVIEARAIVRSQLMKPRFRGSLSKESQEKNDPSASLVVRFSGSQEEPPFSVVAVRDIIAQAVPGLSPEHIGVTLTSVSLGDIASISPNANQKLAKITPFRFHIPVSEKRIAKFQLLGTMIMCVTVGLLIGGGVVAFFRRRKKETHQPSRRETTLLKRDFLIEGGIRSEGDSSSQRLLKE